MTRRRSNQPIDQAGSLDFIAPAERLDDALDVAAARTRVLDELKVFVGSDLLDADKHGAAPCSRNQHHDPLPDRKRKPPFLL